MRQRRSVFLSALAAVFFMLATAWAAGQSLVVQLQTTHLRSEPSFTGRPVAALSYGQSVTVLEENDPWLLVGAPSGKGWLHRSAVAERKSALLAGSRNTAARADEREVSMAGKGFDRQTEAAYRRSHPGGYAALEEMLRYRYTPEESTAFLAAGQGRAQ